VADRISKLYFLDLSTVRRWFLRTIGPKTGLWPAPYSQESLNFSNFGHEGTLSTYKDGSNQGLENETKRKKRKIFRNETKRNGKKFQNQETKRNGKLQETKRNVTILFSNKKTKRKEKNNVS
jgi:hypothetical protein